jgi:hypothetical protein
VEKIYTIISSFIEKLEIKPKWLQILIIIVVLLAGFYIYEGITNQNYYQNIESQVNLLTKLNEVNYSEISTNPDLYPFYQKIIQNLLSTNTQKDLFSWIKSVNVDNVFYIKTLTAGIVWLIMIVVTLFTTKDNVLRKKAIRLFFVIWIISGLLGAITPTIFSPIINYLIYPIIEILIIFILYKKKSP